MNITTLRLRYTQFFIIALLGVSLYATSQSLAGGISQIATNLWGHDFLVTSLTNFRLKIGDRVFQQALVGKEGWLEFTGDGNLSGYENNLIIPAAVLQSQQQKLKKLYDVLGKRKITLLLVIVPNKSTIYPDKLPDELTKLRPQSQLDSFTTYIQKHGPPVLVDLRSALLNGRKTQDIYYKTNTHWNGYGAFIGYTEIMKELSKTYPELLPKNINEFNITPGKPYVHDIPKLMGATSLLEPGIPFTPKENNFHWVTMNDDAAVPMKVFVTPNDNSPTLLMYMDSFGGGMQNLIAPHFSKATFVLNHSQYADTISMQMIDITKPNIVIIEFVERYFYGSKLDDLLNQLLTVKK